MFKDIKKFFKVVHSHLKKPEMLTLPASLAYYLVLSIVPIISILFLIAARFNIPFDYITSFFENNFNSELVKIITPMSTNSTQSFRFIIYIIVSFFLVSNGFDAIIVASNTIFNIKNNSLIKRRIKALGLTLIMFLLLVFILVVPIFGQQLINTIVSLGVNTTLVKTIEFLYPIINIPLTILIIYANIKLIYILSPDDHIKSQNVTKGSIFTTLGWVITTFAYSYYIHNYSEYNLYYAGLSSIVILMIWLYFLGFIFVIGLSMNYRDVEIEIEKTNTIKLKEIEERVRANIQKNQIK